jgi:hypothetical protein
MITELFLSTLLKTQLQNPDYSQLQTQNRAAMPVVVKIAQTPFGEFQPTTKSTTVLNQSSTQATLVSSIRSEPAGQLIPVIRIGQPKQGQNANLIKLKTKENLEREHRALNQEYQELERILSVIQKLIEMSSAVDTPDQRRDEIQKEINKLQTEVTEARKNILRYSKEYDALYSKLSATDRKILKEYDAINQQYNPLTQRQNAIISNILEKEKIKFEFYNIPNFDIGDDKIIYYADPDSKEIKEYKVTDPMLTKALREISALRQALNKQDEAFTSLHRNNPKANQIFDASTYKYYTAAIDDVYMLRVADNINRLENRQAHTGDSQNSSGLNLTVMSDIYLRRSAEYRIRLTNYEEALKEFREFK